MSVTGTDPVTSGKPLGALGAFGLWVIVGASTAWVLFWTLAIPLEEARGENVPWVRLLAGCAAVGGVVAWWLAARLCFRKTPVIKTLLSLGKGGLFGYVLLAVTLRLVLPTLGGVPFFAGGEEGVMVLMLSLWVPLGAVPGMAVSGLLRRRTPSPPMPSSAADEPKDDAKKVEEGKTDADEDK